MNRMLGGMIGPMVQADATTQTAKSAAYRSRFMAGIMIDPMAAVSAAAEPDTPEKMAAETNGDVGQAPTDVADERIGEVDDLLRQPAFRHQVAGQDVEGNRHQGEGVQAGEDLRNDEGRRQPLAEEDRHAGRYADGEGDRQLQQEQDEEQPEQKEGHSAILGPGGPVGGWPWTRRRITPRSSTIMRAAPIGMHR